MLPKTIIQVIQSRVAAIKKISHSNNLEWIFSASHNLRDQCIRLNFSTLLIFNVIIITDSSSCQARIRICVAWREGRFTFDAIEASPRCPALQYLDDVDPGGVADLAGLLPGDFLLAVSKKSSRKYIKFVTKKIHGCLVFKFR